MKSIESKQKSYITLGDGNDFRSIAKTMTKAGFSMNHATARNVWLSATTNFIKALSKDLGIDITEEKIGILLQNEEIHDALADILFLANKS